MLVAGMKLTLLFVVFIRVLLLRDNRLPPDAPLLFMLLTAVAFDALLRLFTGDRGSWFCSMFSAGYTKALGTKPSCPSVLTIQYQSGSSLFRTETILSYLSCFKMKWRRAYQSQIHPAPLKHHSRPLRWMCKVRCNDRSGPSKMASNLAQNWGSLENVSSCSAVQRCRLLDESPSRCNHWAGSQEHLARWCFSAASFLSPDRLSEYCRVHNRNAGWSLLVLCLARWCKPNRSRGTRYSQSALVSLRARRQRTAWSRATQPSSNRDSIRAPFQSQHELKKSSI